MLITFETEIAPEEIVRVSCEHSRIMLVEKRGDPSDIIEGITTNFRAWVDHDEFFLSEKEFFSLKNKLEDIHTLNAETQKLQSINPR